MFAIGIRAPYLITNPHPTLFNQTQFLYSYQ
jgi:hypothetical protein